MSPGAPTSCRFTPSCLRRVARFRESGTLGRSVEGAPAFGLRQPSGAFGAASPSSRALAFLSLRLPVKKRQGTAAVQDAAAFTKAPGRSGVPGKLLKTVSLRGRLVVSAACLAFLLLLGSLDSQAQPARPPGRPVLPPVGGPYAHKILSASSRDGLTWARDEGVRLEHASVPCAVADGDRILLYYVDADRGPGRTGLRWRGGGVPGDIRRENALQVVRFRRKAVFVFVVGAGPEGPERRRQQDDGEDSGEPARVFQTIASRRAKRAAVIHCVYYSTDEAGAKVVLQRWPTAR